MSLEHRQLPLSCVLLTANRPDRAVAQILDASHLFTQLIIGDGGAADKRLNPARVVGLSQSLETQYFADVSWIDRIRRVCELVQEDLVMLMPDDDMLDPVALSRYVERMSNSHTAALAGGPWLREPPRPVESCVKASHRFREDVVGSQWTYQPWFFYGLMRSAVFLQIGLQVIPATVELGHRMDLRSQMSRNRLVELALVLSSQIAGSTIVGQTGFWERRSGRTWAERFAHWECLGELEKSILDDQNSRALNEWSSSVVAAMSAVRSSHYRVPNSTSHDAIGPASAIRGWARQSHAEAGPLRRFTGPTLRTVGRSVARSRG